MAKVKIGLDSITKKSFFTEKKGTVSNTPDDKGQTSQQKPVKKDNTNNQKFKFLKFKKQQFFSVQGIIMILVLLPILFFGVVSLAYQYHNEGRIYDGVNVFGIDAGGKTPTELGKLIDSKIASYKVTIQGDNQKFEATYSNLGINYDKEKIVDTAYEYGRDESVLTNFFNRAKRFFSQYPITLGSRTYAFKKYNVNLTYKLDENKLDSYLSDLESKINVDPQDSRMTSNGDAMQIVPAVFGIKLETADLKNKILASSLHFDTQPIIMKTDVTSPAIMDDKTRALAIEADQITSKPVTLTYEDKSYSPSKSILVSWITFTRNDDKSDWKMVIDQSKMADYFGTIGKDINVYSTTQNIRVENETKEIVTQQGKDGLIINQAALGSQLAAELQSDSKVNIVIPMMVDHFKTQRDYVVVADWDQYIDINLSTQRMDAYLKGGQKVGSWAITSGRDSLPTPLGQFLIMRKSYDVCMPNPPSTQPLCGIHYVSYFTSSGDAIHEAWWRSYFGGQDYHWDGSHGCINAPLSVAQFIYNWAPIGTPVTIHY